MTSNPKDLMGLKERASRIWAALIATNDVLGGKAEKIILYELRKVQEEQWKKACDANRAGTLGLIQVARKEARAEALLQAKKIAVNFGCLCLECCCDKVIAERIQSLIDAEGGK